MNFSNKERSQFITRLKKERFDVLVIGGGITGAGIALDAAARGLKTALIDMQDFAAGTSSRSTKLIHGGLRYLKNFEFNLVAEVGKERSIVYENGPHVTTPEWMVLPIYEFGTFGRFSTSLGLRLYDFLAGVKKTERRTMLTAQETIEKIPLIKKEGLKGGGFYVEYRTDDARLTIEVMKRAFELGALTLNYIKAERILYENSLAIGVLAEDKPSGEKFPIVASKIINATGPWVDNIRELDQSKKGKKIQLTKGVHIVVDQSKFPLKQAVYFDTHDKRMIFAVPRNEKVYIGTTDTFYDGDPINPLMKLEDQNYLIHAVKTMFPDADLTLTDIETSWAGVRPLICEEGKNPSEISRKDEIWESPTGLITIAGGKLTGYRKMAETVVDLITNKLNKERNQNFPKCSTVNMPISGGNIGGSVNLRTFIDQHSKNGEEIGLTREEAVYLSSMYGSNISYLYEFLSTKGMTEAKRYELPLVLWMQLLYALEYEMVMNPCDFFVRRTGDLLFNYKSVQTHWMKVHKYMSDYFQWNEDQDAIYLAETIKALEYAINPIFLK